MTSVHDVIGKEDCKGLMSDKRFCQKDRVAETEGARERMARSLLGVAN